MWFKRRVFQTCGFKAYYPQTVSEKLETVIQQEEKLAQEEAERCDGE